MTVITIMSIAMAGRKIPDRPAWISLRQVSENAAGTL